jgi:hypothetical protein
MNSKYTAEILLRQEGERREIRVGAGVGVVSLISAEGLHECNDNFASDWRSYSENPTRRIRF